MTNNRIQASKEIPPLPKRKRVLAAVTQDIVTSEDDDNTTDSMNICNIIENHTLQHKESATSHALQALGETIRNTLLEINEVREQNRERRHKELLDVLTKITQYESADIGKSGMFKTNNNSAVHVAKDGSDYIIKKTLPDEEPSNNAKRIFKSNNSTTVLGQQKLNQLPENISSIIETTNKTTNVSSVHLATSKHSNGASPVIFGKGQVNAVKGEFALKQNSKEELQKMRTKMLELQRKKMEDRERKKREMQQRIQNS